MKPFVSIIVPCYNEESTIQHLLDAVLAQTYPRERLELVIADGMSTDGTRGILAAYQAQHPEISIHVADNAARTIPAALNQAIQNSRGEIIVRLDAHSMPIPEYVARCVSAHEAGKGQNIGGVWEIRPGADTWMAEAIAYAAAHPLGVGDAMYRLKAKEGAVDTVPFGSFRRALLDKIGMFDESLLANEDYEFNTRARQTGGVVWLDPSIRSVYFARSTLGQLAKQYARYGFWKWKMLRRYPRALRWRQALPPAFVFVLLGLLVLSLFFGLARWLLAAQLILYFSALALAGLKRAIETRKPHLAISLPLAIATMHLSWGAAFLWSILYGKHG